MTVADSTTALQLPHHIQIFPTGLKNSKITAGTQLTPSPRLKNCKTNKMLSTKKYIDMLRQKKVTIQATKHLM